MSKEKFIPNIEQLIKVIKQLPDASSIPDTTYSTSIFINESAKVIQFTKKKIQRGSKKVDRWVYEGKILIREKDKEIL